MTPSKASMADSGVLALDKPKPRPAGGGEDGGENFASTLKGQMNKADKSEQAAREDRTAKGADNRAQRADQGSASNKNAKADNAGADQTNAEKKADKAAKQQDDSANELAASAAAAHQHAGVEEVLEHKKGDGAEATDKAAAAGNGKTLPVALPVAAAAETAKGESAQDPSLAEAVRRAVSASRPQGTSGQTSRQGKQAADATQDDGAADGKLTGILKGLGDNGAAQSDKKAASSDDLLTANASLLAQSARAAKSGNGAAAQQAHASEAVLKALQSNGRDSATSTLNMPTAGPMAAPLPQGVAPAPSTPATLSLPVNVQQPGWDQALGDRIVWMNKEGIKEAQIQLNPRHLGPIEVRLSMQNDQAHVAFTAHHAMTRDALEAAMPRLRDMFNDQGLNLAQSDVFQQSPQHGGQQPGAEDGGRTGAGLAGPFGGAEGSEDIATATRPAVSSSGIGMVDYYA